MTSKNEHCEICMYTPHTGCDACGCDTTAEKVEIAEYASGKITANGVEVVAPSTDTSDTMPTPAFVAKAIHDEILVDTSDWREQSLDLMIELQDHINWKAQTYEGTWLERKINALLEKVRTEAQEEAEAKYGVNADTERAHYDMAFQDGKAAERARLVALAEGILLNRYFVGQVFDEENVNSYAENEMKSYNAALSAFISKATKEV